MITKTEIYLPSRSTVRSIALVVSLLVIVTSLSGCLLWGDDEPIEVLPETEEGFGAFSVVAPIDTGINVYHNHFRMNETYPQWLLEGLGVNKICDVTLNGTWQERYEADKEVCWDNITSEDIVWFRGTRIIGTTPDDNTDIPILDDPQDGHGTAVTGAAHMVDAYERKAHHFVNFDVLLQDQNGADLAQLRHWTIFKIATPEERAQATS